MGAIYTPDGTSQTDNFIEKESEYAMYVIHHKQNVKKAYEDIFLNKTYNLSSLGISSKQYRDTIDFLANEIRSHDNSKFSDNEFEGYRRYYYPTDDEKVHENEDSKATVETNYNEAWKHHYMYNDHHPEHWCWYLPDGQVVTTKLEVATKMPLQAVFHMICDWTGMSYAHNKKDPIDWYLSDDSSDERKCLNPETLKLVNDLLPILFGRPLSK